LINLTAPEGNQEKLMPLLMQRLINR